MLKLMSVVAVVCLIGSTARPEDKPDYAKLIVGKWEVTKADPGTQPEGMLVEFTKDGKMKGSFKIGDNVETFEGTYTLDGDKIKGKVGGRESEASTIVISRTEMIIKYNDGREVTLERVK
jgi:uncharacterized protein (TIGR03066 family)